MNRAAEPHGAVVIFVHHVRKPKGDDPLGARYRIRGSSALYDAAGSVFVFSAEKGEPTRVEHEKCRNRGIPIDDFGLCVEDVESGHDPKAGLRVVHLEAAQLASAKASGRSTYAVHMKRIVDFLGDQDGGEYRGSKTSVLERLRMNKGTYYAAVAELESTGAIAVGSDERGKFVRLKDGALGALRECARVSESDANGRSQSRTPGVESERER